MEGHHVALLALLGVLLLFVGSRISKGPSYRERILKLAVPDKDLVGHTKEFDKPQILKVTEGVHVAIGYALANSIMLEGPHGLIIVDVTESVDSGKNILSGFRKVSNQSIKALIYTHNHADHTYGAKAFIEDPDNPPDIWAHEAILNQFTRVFSRVNTAHFTRAMRQFGVFLPDAVNAGIGLKLNSGALGIVYPNRFVNKKVTDVSIAGIPLQIIHIPGETDDQIGVWIPDRRVFLCADDLYRAFPNLYAIRGTPPRDLMKWVDSLDIILNLGPDYLVPSHTQPLYGKRHIRSVITAYRDAIQYVHDQTVRYINKGLSPEEIVEKVSLPLHLRNHSFLKEFYGTVEWSVKGVFSNYMGWFSGDPVDLQPFTSQGKADRMVKLVGVNKLVDAAKAALKDNDYQWALELSSHVLKVNKDNYEAREVKIDALTLLGSKQTSANGRNYYLTTAFEEASEITLKGKNQKGREMGIQQLPIEQIMYTLPARFKPEDCGDKSSIIYFEFTDTDKHVVLKIRNAVAVITEGPANKFDLKVTSTEQIFREISASRTRALTAYGSGELIVEGGLMTFRNIMGCFERD